VVKDSCHGVRRRPPSVDAAGYQTPRACPRTAQHTDAIWRKAMRASLQGRATDLAQRSNAHLLETLMRRVEGNGGRCERQSPRSLQPHRWPPDGSRPGFRAAVME
jgi:hypothetical protein